MNTIPLERQIMDYVHMERDPDILPGPDEPWSQAHKLRCRILLAEAAALLENREPITPAVRETVEEIRKALNYE